MTNLHSDKIKTANLHTAANHIYTNTKLRKLLVPIIIEQLLASLMGTVDTMMVSNVGSAAISAVSLVDSINILVIQALSALAAGGAILCSQYLGSHNAKGARHAAKQVFFVMAFLSVILSAFCLITRKPLLRAIFGAVEADVMRNSQVYFFFTLLSFPFIGLYDAGASIMRAQNNSRNPMVISVISNFMNIGGNAILIFGFGMGVEGAAISTLISRIFCAIVVIIQLRRENEPIFIRNYMSIRPEWGLIKKILLIGIPSGIENTFCGCGIRKAVPWKSVCIRRNQSDKRCGLFRIYNECICTFRYFNRTKLERSGGKGQGGCGQRSTAGRSAFLCERQLYQSRSTLHRQWTGYPRKYGKERHQDFAVQLPNTGQVIVY